MWALKMLMLTGLVHVMMLTILVILTCAEVLIFFFRLFQANCHSLILVFIGGCARVYYTSVIPLYICVKMRTVDLLSVIILYKQKGF